MKYIYIYIYIFFFNDKFLGIKSFKRFNIYFFFKKYFFYLILRNKKDVDIYEAKIDFD